MFSRDNRRIYFWFPDTRYYVTSKWDSDQNLRFQFASFLFRVSGREFPWSGFGLSFRARSHHYSETAYRYISFGPELENGEVELQSRIPNLEPASRQADIDNPRLGSASRIA